MGRKWVGARVAIVSLGLLAACGEAPSASPVPRTRWPNPPGTAFIEVEVSGGAPPVALRLRPWDFGGSKLPRLLEGGDSGTDAAERAVDVRVDVAHGGRARFDDVPADAYLLEVRDADGRSARRLVRVDVPGQPVVTRVGLRGSTGGAISRGAVTAGGEPVAWARVYVTDALVGDGRWQQALTDTGGRFVAFGVTEDGCRVTRVEAPDGTNRAWTEGHRDLDLLAGTEALSVRVVDVGSGEPVAGASVTFSSEDDTGTLSTTGRAGEDGRVESRVLAGRRRVSVSASGSIARAEVPVSPDSDVALARAQSVRVRVVDARDGSPVPGVILFPQEALGRVADRTLELVRTDAHGVATVRGITSGGLRVTAVGGGFVSPGLRHVDLWQDPGTLVTCDRDTVAEVPVVPARTIRGRVVASDGSPVAGATVMCPTARPSHSRSTRPPEWGATYTDASGRFALTDLPWTGELTPSANARGRHGWARVDAASAADLRIELQDASEVRVTLEAPARADCRIEVERLPDDRAPQRAATAQLQRGQDRPEVFESLRPGRHRVRVVTQGGVASGWAPLLVDSGGRADITLEEPRSISLRGHVEFPPDVAPTRVFGRFSRPGGVVGSWRSAPDGSFEIPGMAEGETYSVSVASGVAEGTLRGRTDAVPGETVRIVLDLDPAAGADTGSRVRLVAPGGEPLTVLAAVHGLPDRRGRPRATRLATCVDGALVLPGAGGAWLEVWDVRDATGRPAGLGAAVVALPVDEIQLAEERTLTGIVRDQDRVPVGGVVVHASLAHPDIAHPSPVPGRHGTPHHAAAVTGDDGTFTLRGLGAVAYDVSVSAWMHRSSEPVRTDLSAPVELSLGARIDEHR